VFVLQAVNHFECVLDFNKNISVIVVNGEDFDSFFYTN